MSALDVAMGGDAPPHIFEHNGRAYKVRAFDVNAQLLYQKRVFREDRELLRETKEDYDADEYSKQLRMQSTAYMAGHYSFLSEKGQVFLNSNAGAQFVGAILFQTDESDFQRLLVARGAEVSAMVKLVLEESFGVSAEQIAAAQKKTQEATSSTLTTNEASKP
jgi:hypothetical protein